MKKAVIYIHGKGGNAKEAEHYKRLFENLNVGGFDYSAQTPWEAKTEFTCYFEKLSKFYQSVVIIANSIGAFFTMNAMPNKMIEEAYFISPVVDMEKLITDMMKWANVSEEQLQKEKNIETAWGEMLSWDYLSYVRQNILSWAVPTHILYAEKDNLTSFETISEFAERTNATLTVAKGCEHWFHTAEQMKIVDDWIKSYYK